MTPWNAELNAATQGGHAVVDSRVCRRFIARGPTVSSSTRLTELSPLMFTRSVTRTEQSSGSTPCGWLGVAVLALLSCNSLNDW